MKGFSPRNEDERAFVKILDELSFSVRRWDVWCDFVDASALAFANAVDKRPEVWQKREDAYMDIVHKRGVDYMKKLAEMLAITTMAFEKNPEQDFLGELYMRLDFGSDWHGQFFTPYHIADFMSKITFEEQPGTWKAVGDCCCGSGVMLIAFANACREKDVNHQQSILFVGQDIDPIVANTIRSVIYDPGQYGPAISGTIDTASPDDRTIENCRYILEHGSILPKTVIGQNGDAEGGGIHSYYYDSILGTTVYFTYSRYDW